MRNCWRNVRPLLRRNGRLIHNSLQIDKSGIISTNSTFNERQNMSAESFVSDSLLGDSRSVYGELYPFDDMHEILVQGLNEDIIDLDIEYAGEESLLDTSIAKAVKQMLDEGPSEPEPTPVEKFQNLYKANFIIRFGEPS